MKDKSQVFLSYARQDVKSAERLFNDLSKEDIRVWADFKSLRPGERWQRSIEKAIKSSDFFIALLSSNSVNKRGFVQKEIVKALDTLEQLPEDSIFVIPARLDECEPSHAVLADLHRVDLFPSWDEGVAAILNTVTASGTSAPLDQKRGGTMIGTPEIRVHGSKKEYVIVEIILVTTGQSYEISLPMDATVDHVIPQLVEQLNLPRELSNGFPIFYRAVSKTQGRTLDGNLTFRQNGVKDREIIGLNVDMVAG